ncbi:MAG: flagellar filament outer layer protein FlaA [Treponema sp.]|nr:flagellar filament outer layer protein FlaA [Treponema sp.]MCL2245376.1 flagellar filament outer layer protein FlaA [Treponema sp.]
MKQMLILVVIAMLAVPLFAEEAVLIDFSLLAADITIGEGDTPNENQRTLMDFSHVAGPSYADRYGDVMRTSLAIRNWEVTLASSSRNVQTMGLSFTREAASREHGTVMGVRVHFPIEPFNSWAMIKPPFDIPAYEVSEVSADGTITPAEGSTAMMTSRFEAAEGESAAYGVVKNVGVIREIKVRVYGLNFPHGLSTLIVDNMGIERTIFMGYLNFDEWGELIWRNPAYLQEVRNREIRLMPLYPFSTPFVKFGGFLIQRDAARPGGDFVTYFRDVSIIYDLAVLDTGRDIDDESIWNIIQTREERRKVFEMERFGHNQVQRYLEQQRQATEAPFNDPSRSNAQ